MAAYIDLSERSEVASSHWRGEAADHLSNGAAAQGLMGTTRDFRDPTGPDLLGRTAAFEVWRVQRAEHGYWPDSRVLHAAPSTETTTADATGRPAEGVNFASQDYLSPATSDTLKRAAIEAINRFGVHSAGSSGVLGNTVESLGLEAELGDFLQMPYFTLYPTGSAAGYGITKCPVRPNDYVVLDALAHNCLMEGATAATRNVSLFRHLDHRHAAHQVAGAGPHGDARAVTHRAALLGAEALARRVAKLQPSHGLLANQVEFSAVPEGRARLQLQVMVAHEPEQARIAAAAVATTANQAHRAAGSVRTRPEFDD